MEEGMVYSVYIFLFHNFETLDAFGPVEIFGCMPEVFQLKYISLEGGIISSAQGVKIETSAYMRKENEKKIILIPGGTGTREIVKNQHIISHIKDVVSGSEYILSVCTGAALLAKAGILNNKKATTNKRSFNWVTEQGKDVIWIRKARWVSDENIFTSSGVSAGIDMALGFIEYLFGKDKAIEISNRIEYNWHEDKDNDPFGEMYK